MDISSIQSYVTQKEFQLLINGILQIVKNQIQENTFQITNNLIDYELLIEKLKTINSELELNDLQNMIQVFELIIKKASVENWSNETITEFLTNRNVPDEYTQIFTILWIKESSKIHQKLVDVSTFNNILSKNIQWRVDMNAMSKQSTDINEAIAHFELNLKPFPRNQSTESSFGRENNYNNDQKKSENIVKFEMNREEVQNILQQFTQIQQVYQQLITKPTTN